MDLSASHLMGGEITWKCQANGQYIFTLLLYRDCAGISIPTGTQTLKVYGHPTFTSITLPNWSTMDITYCQPIYNCFSAAVPDGATEQGIYISNPVTINGIPPAGGWTFAWNSCCRNGALTNVVAAGFSLRATMYPYNGMNANPCFDSSPAFAEKPKSVMCSTKDFIFNHGAFDDDRDSLTYEWGIPLEEPTYSPPAQWIPGVNPAFSQYNPPYTYLSPLPSVPPSTGATIDPSTGEIYFNSFISGNFVTNVKVSSFKCGIKVSEIFREIQFVVLNCDSNNNPDIIPPFPDSTGAFTLFADTIMAGDSVSFMVYTTDFDLDTAGNTQSVTLSAYGSQFGANFTDTATGCLVPPCAVIDVPMPVTASQGAVIKFDWHTTVAHLGMFYPCAYIPNTYYFNFKATDSHCPAPAVNYKTVAITVLPVYPKPAVQNNGGILTCQEANFDYQWYLNRFPVNGATSQSYTPLVQGIYQVRITDSIGSGNYSDEVLVGVLNNLAVLPGIRNVIIRPNPAGDFIDVDFTTEHQAAITISIYDITGRRMFNQDVASGSGNIQEKIFLSEFETGLYTLEILSRSERLMKKLVIAR